MRTTLDLLNEVVHLGFEREEALRSIDAALDDEFGIENRKHIDEEYLDDYLYETILSSFKCEKEWR